MKNESKKHAFREMRYQTIFSKQAIRKYSLTQSVTEAVMAKSWLRASLH